MALPFTVALCSIALRNRPIAEALEIIAAGGFRAVEIWYAHVEKLTADEVSAVAEQCRRLEVNPIVLAPYLSFTRGSEWREKSLETARGVLAAAEILGVKKMRTFVDIGPDGLSSADATEEDWREACAGLRDLCALDPATEFVIETHEHTLADTLPTIERLLKEVDRPNLKLNFQINEDFRQRGFMKCLEILYPHVAHMHWAQLKPNHTEGYIEESGLYDYSQIIGWLVSKGYRGTASVEYCWSPVDESRIPTAALFLEGIAADLDRAA